MGEEDGSKNNNSGKFTKLASNDFLGGKAL
jgi:hypothetical protein